MSPEKRKKYSESRLKWLSTFVPTEDYYKKIAEKSKATSKKNGTKIGRPKGPRSKAGEHKPCPVCNTLIYYSPKDIRINKRKCCSKKCLFKDPVYIQKLKNIDKSYMQTKEYYDTVCKPDTSEFRRYPGKVHRLTKKTYELYKDLINPNNYPRTIAGIDGGYHLDHIISIRYGFDNNIPAEDLAVVENLQMLPWRENIVKGKSL